MIEFSTEWLDSFSGAVTICDTKGIIVYMNPKAQEVFQKYGGKSLVGTNLLDCHPEPARSKLQDMLENATSNIYTIEKNGIKKLIHQTPFYKNNIYSGFIELSLEIPGEMPHFIRT